MNHALISAIRIKIRTRLGQKLLIALFLNGGVYASYFFLQRHPLFPVITLGPGPLDDFIPFHDQWTWFYQSIYLFIPIAPLLMVHEGELRRYTIAVAAITLLASAIFLLCPTAVVRPDASTVGAAYRWLITVDTPLNAFPSLHAAFTVFSALAARRVLHDLQGPGFWQVAIWLWASAIVYSTLATKQHVMIDVVAGAAMGWSIHSLTFHSAGITRRLSRPHIQFKPADLQ